MIEFVREFARYWSPNEIAKRLIGWVIRQHFPVELATGEAYCMNYVCRKGDRPPPWPCDEFLRLDRQLDSLER